MRYFGEPTDAPVYEGIQPSVTPVGKQCWLCLNVVEEGERGFLLPHSGEFDPDQQTLVAGVPHSVAHRDCLIESIAPGALEASQAASS